MLVRLKCLFFGHKWKYHKGLFKTVIWYKCKRCGKKESIHCP